ncbi:MAG: polysaccharide deacetylase family protein [Candidatus Krumholzibacteriia bacterium]
MLPSVLAVLVVIAACGPRSDPAQDKESTAPAGASSVAAGAAPADAPLRAVAITFDDLPHARAGAHSLAFAQETTRRLLRTLDSEGIPAVGFVTEGQIDEAEHPEARTALLEAWLEAGMELGNHTWGHERFRDTPLAEYQDEVLRGERITRRLMTERGMRLRFFRHPYLNTGPDLQTRRAFESFLAAHGYRIAPVTIDNDDYIYALAYDRAIERGDGDLMRRIGEDYVRFMDTTFAFFERLSLELLDREPAQVLLLHASRLNADSMDELAAMMRERGYRFVSLEEALEDPAYALPDRYTGRNGPSWLKRWAITQGADPGEPPDVPRWVRRIASR